MNEMYKLKYKDKWMKITRVLGTYSYELYDNASEVDSLNYRKALSGRNLVAEDCNLNKDEILIVKI